MAIVRITCLWLLAALVGDLTAAYNGTLSPVTRTSDHLATISRADRVRANVSGILETKKLANASTGDRSQDVGFNLSTKTVQLFDAKTSAVTLKPGTPPMKPIANNKVIDLSVINNKTDINQNRSRAIDTPLSQRESNETQESISIAFKTKTDQDNTRLPPINQTDPNRHYINIIKTTPVVIFNDSTVLNRTDSLNRASGNVYAAPQSDGVNTTVEVVAANSRDWDDKMGGVTTMPVNYQRNTTVELPRQQTESKLDERRLNSSEHMPNISFRGDVQEFGSNTTESNPGTTFTEEGLIDASTVTTGYGDMSGNVSESEMGGAILSTSVGTVDVTGTGDWKNLKNNTDASYSVTTQIVSEELSGYRSDQMSVVPSTVVKIEESSPVSIFGNFSDNNAESTGEQSIFNVTKAADSVVESTMTLPVKIVDETTQIYTQNTDRVYVDVTRLTNDTIDDTTDDTTDDTHRDGTIRTANASSEYVSVTSSHVYPTTRDKNSYNESNQVTMTPELTSTRSKVIKTSSTTALFSVVDNRTQTRQKIDTTMIKASTNAGISTLSDVKTFLISKMATRTIVQHTASRADFNETSKSNVTTLESKSGLSTRALTAAITGSIIGFWVILGPIICIICKLRDRAKGPYQMVSNLSPDAEAGITERMVMTEMKRSQKRKQRNGSRDSENVKLKSYQCDDVGNGEQDGLRNGHKT